MTPTRDLAARSGRVVAGNGGTGAARYGANHAGTTRKGE
jgi:hypothetical protein